MNVTAIRALCEKYRVGELSVFGSVLTSKFGPSSDIDFVVRFKDMPKMEYADNYFDLKNALQQVVGRPVDLVEYNAISNPFFLRSVNNSKQLIYG